MIDWSNPSDDVMEARRIGYQEGWLAGEEVARELEDRLVGEAQAAIAVITKERNELLLRIAALSPAGRNHTKEPGGGE
jgi:hypothetical protein